MIAPPFERNDKELVVHCLGVRVWVDYDDVDHDEAERVARLIAAAPDLLEALIYARRFLKAGDHDTEFVDGAIAKARGTP